MLRLWMRLDLFLCDSSKLTGIEFSVSRLVCSAGIKATSMPVHSKVHRPALAHAGPARTDERVWEDRSVRGPL